MDYLRNVRLIQGGMGVHVSNWRLARAVAMERPGETAGTVSGTALDVVYARLLQLGDPGGHARRALRALDDTFGTEIGASVLDRYFIDGGKTPGGPFQADAPMHLLRAPDGAASLRLPRERRRRSRLTLDDEAIELLIATGFAEVWLAKEGHDGRVFINFLNKIEPPLLYALYGAMLAGVDGVLIGAGNPDGLPAICSRLANHEPVHQQPVRAVSRRGRGVHPRLRPARDCRRRVRATPRSSRPAFLAIVSLRRPGEGAGRRATANRRTASSSSTTRRAGTTPIPVGPLRRDARGPADLRRQGRSRPGGDRGSAHAPSGWPAGTAAATACACQGGRRRRHPGGLGLRPGRGVGHEGATTAPRSCSEFKNGTDDDVAGEDHACSRRRGSPSRSCSSPRRCPSRTCTRPAGAICDLGVLQQWGVSKAGDDGHAHAHASLPLRPDRQLREPAGLERSTEQRRCLCNGLLACVGLGQVHRHAGGFNEEPAIITLGNHLDGARRLSRQGQAHYWARDVVADILGEA